jgi:23S rRNA pseudouridine2457 synthase
MFFCRFSTNRTVLSYLTPILVNLLQTLMAKLILFNKPFKVLSQFTSEGSDKKNLAEYISIPNVYAAGRLDYDSEGLLALTDDGLLQHRIADPKHKSEKTYWVQVEGIPKSEAIQKLRNGINLNDGLTKPAKVKIINEPDIWERSPPIRERANIPTCWLEITIYEGRNRQVRRMTAAINHPTLRLIRAKIGEWIITDIKPGEFKELEVIVEGNKKPTYSKQTKLDKIHNTKNRQAKNKL